MFASQAEAFAIWTRFDAASQETGLERDYRSYLPGRRKEIIVSQSGKRIFRSFSLSLLCLIILLSVDRFSIFASTGARLHGYVLDQSGAAVAGAAVRLSSRDGLQQSTASNADGAYSFDRVLPGEYLVEIEAARFAKQVNNVRLTADEDRTLHFSLKVAGIAEQVVITASSTAQSVDEISKSVSVVDSEQIEARNEFSISESLRLVPGLRVQQLGGPGSFTTIRTRGLRSEDTAILIDGLRFRDAATAGGDATSFIEDLMVVDAGRLEILKGSGSSLYGTNAIGGAINIITDQGGGPTHGHVQAEGGSAGFFRGRVGLSGNTLGRVNYSVGIAHLNVSRGVDRNDAARNSSGQGRIQIDFTPSVTLSGRIFTSDAFLQLNDSPFAAPAANLPAAGVVPAIPLPEDQQRLREAGLPFNLGGATFIPGLDDPDNRRNSRFFAGAIVFQHRLNETASYRISFHTVTTRRAFIDGPGGSRFEPVFNNSSQFKGRIDTLSARTDLRLGRHNLASFGYEFESEQFRNSTRNENPDLTTRINTLTRTREQSHAFFVQDQIQLLDGRLQFSAATRIQTFSLSRPEFHGGAPRYAGRRFDAPATGYTGDGSVSYFVRSTGSKLRAHVGNGYRAPSLFQRFGSSFSTGSFSAFGDPLLRPDRSIAFDAGIDQTLMNGRVQASANYFYTRLQEVIVFDSGLVNDLYGRISGYRNTGGGLARGVDVSVHAMPLRSLDLTVSYTYTNADERRPLVPDFLTSFGVSDHTFTLLVNQRLGRRVDLTFDLFAAGDYTFPFLVSGIGNRPFRFGGPVKADLGANWVLPVAGDRSVRLYAKAENILDHRYFENGFRTPGTGFAGGLAFRF